MYERRSDEFFLVLVVLAVVKAAITRWFALGSADLIGSIALEGAAVVALLCVVDIVPRRRNVWLDLGAYALLTVVMYGNLLYASYFDQMVDPSTLTVADQVGSVGDVIVGLIKPAHILYVLDMSVLVAWAIDLTGPGAPRAQRSRTVAGVALAGVIAVCAQVVAVGRLSDTADTIAVARTRGLGIYQIASLLRGGGPATAAPNQQASSDSTLSPGARMQRRIDSLRHGSYGQRVEGVVPGAHAKANVFVIQVESYQAMAFGATLGGEEITPQMNRLVDASWLCSNAFSQSGAGNTADAEFIVNTSLLPPPNRAASVAYADREVTSLPRALSKAGYRTVTMHANDIAFWNRKELYSALGFDTFYDKAQFGEEDMMYRGASDEVFFERAESFINNELQMGQPLYVQLVTLSSHAPYRGVPYDRRPLDVKKRWQGSRAADWLGALSYTDKAVGEFIDWLKTNGLWDSSVVIVYGDHTAIKDLELEGADREVVDELLGRQYSEVDRQRIPLLIHLPGQTEPRVIDGPVGQIDIAPTIADVLGIDLSDTPHLGRSVFVNSNPFVITRSYFPPGSFINAQSLFMPGTSFDDGTALDAIDGWPTTPSEREYRDLKRAQELSGLSHEWVSGLPRRDDAGDISDAYIPVKSQRPGAQEQ